jgi:hypothetical protein
LVDDADIASEFMFGALKALDKVSFDRGDPMLYLLWKGNLAVAHLLRTRIQRGVKAHCFVCAKARPIRTVGGKPTCRTCGSRDLNTYMVEDSGSVLTADGRRVDILDKTVGLDAEAVWNVATYGIQIQEMRSRLRGRVLELFDMIVVKEVNRDSSQNYLREIEEYLSE